MKLITMYYCNGKDKFIGVNEWLAKDGKPARAAVSGELERIHSSYSYATIFDEPKMLLIKGKGVIKVVGTIDEDCYLIESVYDNQATLLSRAGKACELVEVVNYSPPLVTWADPNRSRLIVEDITECTSSDGYIYSKRCAAAFPVTDILNNFLL